MALLDMSEVLEDSELNDVFSRVARAQAVDDHGEASDSEATDDHIGVVTSAGGDKIVRKPDGSFVTGALTIHTKTRLRDGKDGYDADVVIWNNTRYNVINVSDYSHIGPGFVCATCEIVPFSGAA